MYNIEVVFSEVDDELSELLIAELSIFDYESFWQEKNELRAYIKEQNFKVTSIDQIISKYNSKHNLSF